MNLMTLNDGDVRRTSDVTDASDVTTGGVRLKVSKTC